MTARAPAGPAGASAGQPPSLKQRLDALGVAITPELLARARDSRDAALLVELGLESAVSA